MFRFSTTGTDKNINLETSKNTTENDKNMSSGNHMLALFLEFHFTWQSTLSNFPHFMKLNLLLTGTRTPNPLPALRSSLFLDTEQSDNRYLPRKTWKQQKNKKYLCFNCRRVVVRDISELC